MSFKEISDKTGIPYHKVRIVLNNNANNILTGGEVFKLKEYFYNIIANLDLIQKKQK